jgi:DNA-binding GntR family transcriptional regulator
VVLEYRGLNEVVYDSIKEKILSSDFPSGHRLQEEHLVKIIGTSKTPIKIALAKLEQEGLVQTIPRRGTYVLELTEKMMVEIYTLREVLEGLAARGAAIKITDNVLKKIKDNLSKFDPKQNNITLKRYLELDGWFHQTIIKEATHSYLEDSLKRLFDVINMFKLRAASVRQNSGDPYREHLKIFKAVEARDPGAAEESMRFHIRQVMQVLCDNFKRPS